MSVVDPEAEEIADIESEDDVGDEDGEDAGLLEEEEDEGSDVSRIIDPDIAKDER
jgi:hypothetical protein